MFAPPIAKVQRKTVAGLTDSVTVAPVTLFQRSMNNQAPAPAPQGPRPAAGPVPARADWSFADITVFDETDGLLQTKLRVSSAGDPLEHEADAVAERVMRMADPHPPNLQNSDNRLQRKCSACEEDDKKQQVMRKKTESASILSGVAPPSVHDVLRSSGRPLDPAARAVFEPRFGYDFGHVRIHTDGNAAQSAREVGALAYTVGSHVAFADGQYKPGAVDGQKLLAHELAHVVQQSGRPSSSALSSQFTARPVMPHVARQPNPTGPVQAPCTIDCTSAAFTALSTDARTAQFNQQCPQGYPKNKTFFGQPIPGATSAKLRAKLLEAESKARRAMCLNGQDPNSYTLDRAITTYPTHSPSEEKAVDIDVQGQPYIMHESKEGDIDKDIGPVYDRIQFWAHYQKSIIPKAITSVGLGKGGGTARTWTNPQTGAKKEAITTGELYDKLKSESLAMTGYFSLLSKNDKDLQIELEAFLTFNTDPLDTVTKLGIPTDTTIADAQTFRQRIADDYRLLGGSKAQLKDVAGQATADASKTPKTLKGDRPFEKGAVAGATLKGGAPDPAANRRPELGFVSLPKEVVVALTEVGLVWGAIDFGPESGDVMHFDCRNIC